MATAEQKRKAAAQTGIYLLVIAAIVIVANLLASKAYKRVDVTKNDRYTLSQGSGRLVHGLKTPIQVDAYVQDRPAAPRRVRPRSHRSAQAVRDRWRR